MMDNTLACVLLAAGESKRFKGDSKLTAPFREKPLVEHILDVLPQALFSQCVVVTANAAVQCMAADKGFETVYLQVDAPDISISIRAGLKSVRPDCTGCMFLVCDQPLLRRESIRLMTALFIESTERIIALGYGEMRGNPVLFPKSLFGALMTLPLGKGGNYIIGQNRDRLLTVQASCAEELWDVDTVEDLERMGGLALDL